MAEGQPVTMDAVLQSADVGPPSFAGGGIATLADQRVPDPGTRAAYPPLVPSLVPGGSGTINLVNLEKRQLPAGGSTRNFSIRTPPQGVPLGAVRLPSGEYVRGQLTGDYGRSTSEIPPQALGIPQQVIDHFRLKNQERTSTSYNIGIAAYLPRGMLPAFMARVLDPKSANVSYGKSSQEIQNVTGQRSNQSDIRRGIGGTAEFLRGIWGNQAPTVGVQYNEQNGSDKVYRGNVGIPMERGSLNLYATRRPDETRFGVRGGFSF